MPHTPNGFFYLDDGIDYGAERKTNACFSLEHYRARMLVQLCEIQLAVCNAADVLCDLLADAMREMPRNTVGFVRDSDRKSAFRIACRAVNATENCKNDLRDAFSRMASLSEDVKQCMNTVNTVCESDSLRHLYGEIMKMKVDLVELSCVRMDGFCTDICKDADMEHMGASASPNTVANRLFVFSASLRSFLTAWKTDRE